MKDSGHIFRGAWLSNNGAASGGAAPSVLPSGAVIILDSSDLSSLTLSGSDVDAWTSTGSDTSAYNYASGDITHSGTGSSAEVIFSGTNNQLLENLHNSVATWHIFAVFAPTGTPTSSFVGATSYQNAPIIEYQQFAGLRLMNSGGIRAQAQVYQADYYSAESAILTSSEKVVVEALCDGTNLRVAINGGSYTSTALAGSYTNAALWSRIGYPILGSARLIADINQIVVYENTVLTGADRTQAIDHLSAKWGVTA